MGKKLGEAALGMLPSAAGAIFGIAMQGANDRRQIEQQKKLQHLQMQGNKEMTDYQQAAALKMWNDTGYGAQMKQMKGAGLNPALMYGMGGGGGQSAGVSAGNVSGGSAPVGGGEILGGMGIGLQTRAQIELLKAQKENIQADTANKTGDAANKPLVGKNIEANTAKTGIETEIGKVQLEIQGKSAMDQIDIINTRAQQAVQELDAQARANEMSWAAYDTELEVRKNAFVTLTIENQLKGVQIDKGRAEIEKIAADIAQRWEELDIKTFEAEMARNFPALTQVAGNKIVQIWDEVDKLISQFTKRHTKTTPHKVEKR